MIYLATAFFRVAEFCIASVGFSGGGGKRVYQGWSRVLLNKSKKYTLVDTQLVRGYMDDRV